MTSPVLDFSETSTASMTFDVSYANKSNRNDQLEIWASTNCGKDYDLKLYSKKGSELAIQKSETEWVPQTAQDWKSEFINLNALAGSETARLAFVVTNQNGNNLYLDNIELYVSDEENPVAIEEPMVIYPNPASDHIAVKLNFNIKETIRLRLISLQGKVVAEQSFPNTLNQTYRIDRLGSVESGIYVIQVLGNYTNLSGKVVVRQ